jgi:hypothetical protein
MITKVLKIVVCPFVLFFYHCVVSDYPFCIFNFFFRSLCFCTFYLAIVLSVLLWFMASDYPFVIFNLFFRSPVFVLFHLTIVLSVLLWLIASDYPFKLFLDINVKYIYMFKYDNTTLMSVVKRTPFLPQNRTGYHNTP